MPDDRRAWHPGGAYFFTVNALQRRDNDLLTRHIALLRETVRRVRRAHPFLIHGWVVLPDHLHCVIELPPGDADFASRWRLIKAGFLERLADDRTALGGAQATRRTWRLATAVPSIRSGQVWEHLIRDERDFAAHRDYVHFNPVKHGYVRRVAESL